MTFFNKHGLINAGPREKGHVDENTFLYSLTLFFLMIKTKTNPQDSEAHVLQTALVQYMEAVRRGAPPVYDNLPSMALELVSNLPKDENDLLFFGLDELALGKIKYGWKKYKELKVYRFI